MTLLLLELALAGEPVPTRPPDPAPNERAVAVVSAVHGADAPARVPYGATWDTWGHVRARVDWMNDPKLDEAGTRSGRDLWFSSRFLYGARWTPSDRVSLVIEVEEFSGAFAGDKTDIGTAADPEPFRVPKSDFKDIILAHPRQLAVTLTHPEAGQIRIGAQTFTWGLGMLANDGAGDPDFGDPEQGNINARLLLGSAPFRNKPGATAAQRGFSFFLAGDLVLRDDNAWIYQGDIAAAGVLGARVQAPRFEVGGLVVGRWQQDHKDPLRPDGDRAITHAFPLDFYTRVLLTNPENPWRLTLEGEAALIHGHTTRPWTEEAAGRGANIQSAGAVARLRFDHDPARLTLKAEVGFATGDNDPRDRVSRSFTFHSDYEVGLVLFEQVMPLLTARAADRAVDRSLVAQPVPGARFAIQQGALTNTVYVNPTLRVRPVPAVDLRLGYLGAWSAGDSYDLFLSGIGGGYPVGWGGQDASAHHLGDELDLSARYHYDGPGNFQVTVGAEGGLFAPGKALALLDQGLVGTVRGHLDLRW
jgi:hypothetical protein